MPCPSRCLPWSSSAELSEICGVIPVIRQVALAVRSYRPLPILPGSKDGGWGWEGWEGWEMTTPAAVDSKLCQALRMPGAGKMKVFTVWGNRNRSTPGTYRQLLAQTLKKAKDVHCTWQPQEVWMC